MARKSQRTKGKNNKSEKKEQVRAEPEPDAEPPAQKKQVPEPKTKPIVKAKKYKQKTYEEQQRINKSKVQRIFLLSANRNEQGGIWHFTVQGQTGKQYFVNVSTVVHCTCMDFRFKSIPCKHIYFIVTQVGQNDQLLDYFKKDRKISKNAYKILDQQLLARLKSRLQKPAKDAKDIDLKDDTDCVICFSEMEKQTEALQDCGTCKKYFHSQCIMAWKTHNPTCPLCRGNLTKQGTSDDPLGKLTGVKL